MSKIASFKSITSCEKRIEFLRVIGVKRREFSEEQRECLHRVKSCRSEVWRYLAANLLPDKSSKVEIAGDASLSVINGILILLVEEFEGSSVEQLSKRIKQFLNDLEIDDCLEADELHDLKKLSEDLVFTATLLSSFKT